VIKRKSDLGRKQSARLYGALYRVGTSSRQAQLGAQNYLGALIPPGDEGKRTVSIGAN
jgi:hypothetical protein